jgi:hypothetical protein
VTVEATYDAKHASLDAHVASYETHCEDEQKARLAANHAYGEEAEMYQAEAEAHHAACLTLLAIIEKDTP